MREDKERILDGVHQGWGFSIFFFLVFQMVRKVR